MRRFTLMGLGALSALTLASGPAVPAGAVVVPPGLVTIQVCNALPAGLGGVLDSLAANANALTLLGDGLSDASADLSDKTLDLIAALVAHVQTVDAGGTVSVTATVVSARVSAYADAAAAWTKAWKDVDAAELQGQVLGNQQGILEAIQAALCEGEPEANG